MKSVLRWLMTAVVVGLILPLASIPANAAMKPEQVMANWYRLVLELVRHTPNYSPPVASRSFAYFGVTAYEATASGPSALKSLSGQLNELADVPARDPAKNYDEGVVINAAMTFAANNFFTHTGPTGQRALAAMTKKMREKASEGVAEPVATASQTYGEAVAAHILKWSITDGGAVIENMGFPREFTLAKDAGSWVPTSKIAQQQVPLLPDWGNNRPFAMPSGSTCGLPNPPEYSEDPNSQFYKEALEVQQAVTNLDAEQRIIARFWSDDPMLSPTPPGHWIVILNEVLDKENADMDRRVEALALLGIGVADGFIGCWDQKFKFNLVRPVTYIKKVIDAKWEPLLITPPFPEYPSGHSTQSGAAAAVLTKLFGDSYAFDDATHVDDGLPVRQYKSFWHAAEEAGISRLYGGIHYRAAIVVGLDQGRCIGAYVTALKTRK